MIHCPNCDVPLSTADLRAGNCPVCHTMVTPDMETIPASLANRNAAPPLSSLTSPTHGEIGGATDEHATLPVANEPSNRESNLPQQPPRHRRMFAFIGSGVVVALVILLATTVLVRQAHTSSTSSTTAQSPVATATPIVVGTQATPSNAGATSNPTQLTGTPIPAATNGTAPATVTPVTTTAPSSTATATPAGQPALNVSPLTFSLLACVNAQVTFTITNVGTATLQWSANTSYTLKQPAGTLVAGAHTAVIASGIYRSGNVTVTATDLAGNPLTSSPQTVTITCTV